MSQEEKHPVKWSKSTLYAILLVSATAFTGPGMFGALNGLGAGGGAKPEIANAANAIVFGVIAVFSIVSGAIANRISPKYTLLVNSFFEASAQCEYLLTKIAGYSWVYTLCSRTLYE